MKIGHHVPISVPDKAAATAETHAVKVFARNLRNLLLQPPLPGRRVLAVDPGFKAGCKLAAIDENGQLCDHGHVHIIGSVEKKAAARAKMVELIQIEQTLFYQTQSTVYTKLDDILEQTYILA